MVTPRRSVTKVRGIRGFIVAFLTIAAAILLIARPIAVNAEKLSIDVKEGDKARKMEIVHDSDHENVVATVDGKEVKVSNKQTFPIILGPHTQKIVAIHPGPVIVFEGSTCVLIGRKWIAYPPGTICP
jgi:hypothetical protein